MAKPYSDDLRKRAMSALAAGETTRAVATQFSVATSTVVKWAHRLRNTGDVRAGQMGGHRPRVLEDHRAFIHDVLGEMPHLTLHGLKDLLALWMDLTFSSSSRLR